MNTQLGIHIGTGSRNGYGKTAPYARGIVAFAGGGEMAEISNDAFRLFRPDEIYKWPPGSSGGQSDIMPGFDQLGMDDMVAQADYWWPVFKQAIDKAAALNGRIDATQITNETGGNDPFQLRKMVLYEERMGYNAAADGYSIAVGNLGTNSPDWDSYLWQSIIAPHIVKMWSLGHYYDRHAYADRVNGADYLIIDGKPAGASSGRPFKEIEFFRKEYGFCGPIILGEIGFVSFPGVDHFMQEIKKYDAYMQNYPEIGYGAIFEYGDWNSGRANIQTASQPLADYLKANLFKKWIPVWEDTPIEPPETKHKAIVVKIPQTATLAEVQKAVANAFANRHTFTQSHDDMMSLLRAGNDDSYVKFANPDKDLDAVEMVEDAGYDWQSLYEDKPEPEPEPEGKKIDLLPYIKGDGRLYEVRNSSGSQERFQSQYRGFGEFWQTKNQHAEQFFYASSSPYIFRGWDTSPGGGRYYVQQGNANETRAPWLARYMAVGEIFTTSLHVQFYTWDCKPSAANSGNVTDTRQFVEHLTEWTSPYGVTVQDVIVIKWVNGGEYYYYARDFGLVAWGRTHNDPNTPMASAISEVHKPGARRDNVVVLPDCLA